MDSNYVLLAVLPFLFNIVIHQYSQPTRPTIVVVVVADWVLADVKTVGMDRHNLPCHFHHHITGCSETQPELCSSSCNLSVTSVRLEYETYNNVFSA